MHIIVVEDFLDLRDTFVEFLQDEGFHAAGVSCGEELDEQLALNPTDLIILDVNLPGDSGLEIAKRLRYAYPDLHILMLTALGSEADRIHGYEHGADIYLVKPVSPIELSAAVRSVERRIRSVDNAVDSGLVLNLSRMTLAADGIEVSISGPDIALIKALSLAPNRRLPHWRLFEATERPIEEPSKHQLELQVFRLRKKFREIGASEKLIKSIRNEGYQLTNQIKIEN